LRRTAYALFMIAASELSVVYALHAFGAAVDPRAMRDGQYPIALMFFSTHGLIGGSALVGAIAYFSKRKPSLARRALWFAGGYAVLCGGLSALTEHWMLPPDGIKLSGFILSFTPISLGFSVMGLSLVIFYPRYWFLGPLVLSPLATALWLVYRRLPAPPPPDYLRGLPDQAPG